jgi:hypothetical protein
VVLVPQGHARAHLDHDPDSASTLFNTANSTVASLRFAQGDPKLSFDEVVARHVAALTPRAGGPLKSGAIDVASHLHARLREPSPHIAPPPTCGSKTKNELAAVELW